MLKLAGYKVTEKLHTGVATVIYRGLRELDQKPVILKILKSQYPTLEEITRLRQEYNMTHNLECQGIIKTYSLEKYQNAFALILEDFGGQSVREILNTKKLSLKETLDIIYSLTNALNYLHQIPIIHKDIKPSNILINPDTKVVKLTDFSIASRLSIENPSLNSSNLLEGTLTYISPEQTGRMNRLIDYRTDFYSLGATFYEMLTGMVPFTTTEPIELIHCHLAKQPLPPHQFNREAEAIPKVVSDIVMKLLAKMAEDRYQSATGLKSDLETCLFQLEHFGKIENFSVGEQDRGSQLLIPQKLYGREAEIKLLMEAFERVAKTEEQAVDFDADFSQNPEQGTAELILISGYSGIGKTSVIHEVHKPIVKARGYFIEGKFDQFKRDIPYSAFIQAFAELIRSLLTEPSERLDFWRENLQQALGENGQVIIDVIPELELIVGPQNPVAKLGLSESQNRFNRVFQNFIHVFCQPEHPLVLFLDDLQWADLASLKLIQLLMTDCDRQYLLMIGAYRDNEVSPTHPLIQTLDKIQELGATVNQITLKPLALSHVQQILIETLKQANEQLLKLAELLFNKTQGNPFFLTQLLKTLSSEHLLVYQVDAGGWRWDLEQIQGIGITDYSVVELIARNIQKLPQKTQNILKLAACIGNQFNLDILGIAHESSSYITAQELWPALQAGLILPLNNAYKIPLLISDSILENREKKLEENGSARSNPRSLNVTIYYKFLHDRVQQATYSLIPEDKKQETHLKIGQLLLKNSTPESQKENIFALVNQLNFGYELITERVEKNELAILNLMAGQKAKSAAAYEVAAKYLNIGLKLLTNDSWYSQHDLTLNLHLEAAEAEFLNTNFEQAQIFCDAALKGAKTLLEKVQVYELKIEFYTAQNEMQLALETALFVLEMLGVSLESKHPSQHVIENLVDLPEMTDPYKLAALRVLNAVSTAVYIVNPALSIQIILTKVNLCINSGNSTNATMAYIYYALHLTGSLEDIESGYQYGELALKLLEQFNTKELRSMVLDVFNGHVKHWKAHVKETLEPLLEALQSGIETGELVYSGYAALNYCTNLFFIGEHLESVDQKLSQYLSFLEKLNLSYHVLYGQICKQLVLNFRGLSEDKFKLIGEAFNEAEMISVLIETQNGTSLFFAYLAKSMLLYFLKQPELALTQAQEAEQYAPTAMGLLTVAEHNFYYSLALLAEYSRVDPLQQLKYLNQVSANQEKMKIWADHAPSNFEHKYQLVEAEKARVLGLIAEAISLYDQAIQNASKFGYLQEEALASELAAEFHLGRGAEKIAQFYFIEAYYTYIRWGAIVKVKDLQEKYPQFLSRIRSQKQDIEVNQTTTTTSTENSNVFDLATVMKAAQTISSEILLPQLLKKLIKILIENAGAQKGFLILNQDEKLVISASSSIEDDRKQGFQSGSFKGNDQEVFPSFQAPSFPLANPKSKIQNPKSSDDAILWEIGSLEPDQVLPMSLLNYVKRTRQDMVLAEATQEGIFITDPYIIKNKPKSILCTPIITQGKFIGLLYLENNLTAGAFTAQRLKVLKLLSSQAAISIENARLVADLSETGEQLKHANEQLEEYSRTLEVKVFERTQELLMNEAQLRDQATQLEKALRELQQTQTQLIQTEKMSSLGQLVAGIAHEINNPINFIYGNLSHAMEYTQKLLGLIQLYQHTYSTPTQKIASQIEEIELDYLKEDLPKVIESMQVGAERICKIVLSLRNFSRLDESSMKAVDIHEGIESTLMLLQPRLKKEGYLFEIQLIKEYSDLPLLNCYAAALNQVFMNILTNAIDVLEQSFIKRKDIHLLPQKTPTIWIRTEMGEDNSIVIRIADNGCGMQQSVKEKIFDPFFTTKPVGSGTGLGLSISYQIVVEKHGGKLTCISTPGEGSEFIIEIPHLTQY